MQLRDVLVLPAACTVLCQVSLAQGLAVGDLVVAKHECRLEVEGEPGPRVRGGQELVVERAEAGSLRVNDGAGVGSIKASEVTLSAKKPKRVSFSLVNRIIPEKGTELVIFTTLVPTTIPGRQTIRVVDYSRRPDRVFRKHGNTYALFIVPDLEHPVTIRIDIEADVYRFDLETASEHPATVNREGASDLNRWLRDEEHLESSSAEIRAVAQGIRGKDDLQKARNVMARVSSALRYSKYRSEPLGARRALLRRNGDCTEYADLFVALCRAKGIPARTSDGFLQSAPRKGDTAKHEWAEIYLKQHGWIPVDPLHIELKRSSFERMPNRYVYATRVRNDPILQGYEFCHYRYRGRPIRFEDEVILRHP